MSKKTDRKTFLDAVRNARGLRAEVAQRQETRLFAGDRAVIKQHNFNNVAPEPKAKKQGPKPPVDLERVRADVAAARKKASKE